ncbi:MAG: AAA family ATPase, partial [Acidimicrobiales bacterium]
MIRNITLENWRAYRSLDLDVEPGTTFLVAPNGVGKSSLLEAVRWALAAGNVAQRPSMVRQGHPAASVAVTLATPAGELVVRRSLKAKGARLTAEVTATLDGRDLSEDEAVRNLEESWSADARFVSRTAFLTEDLRRDAEDPNLRTHLCRAYSLDDLQTAMAEIEPALAQLSKGLKSARAELSGTKDQLRTAEEELVVLAAAVTVAQAQVESARTAHAEARA